MDDKYMVNDILESSKYEIKTYSDAIVQTENPDLRQTLQSIRSNLESFEYELFKLAISNVICSSISSYFICFKTYEAVFGPSAINNAATFCLCVMDSYVNSLTIF